MPDSFYVMGFIWYPSAQQQTLSEEVIKLNIINIKVKNTIILFALSNK